MRPLLIVFLGFLFGCSDSEQPEIELIPKSYNLLSLGDSYTIGTGVCDSCSYPIQLRDSLVKDELIETSLDIIATSGWTTTNLIDAVEKSNIDDTFDLVTLLIGVNNQFQNKPFSVYENELEILINKAIEYAQNDPNHVIVLSIPDYAFTPFGQNWGDPINTSAGIDTYNEFAKSLCLKLDITYLNITDISRNGIIQPELIASDGLHLSELAYHQIVKRLFPIAKVKLTN